MVTRCPERNRSRMVRDEGVEHTEKIERRGVSTTGG